MSLEPSQHDELHDLLIAMEEGSLSPDGIARIDELVRADSQLLRQYLEYVRLASDLRFGQSGDLARSVLSRVLGLESEADWPGGRDRLSATEPARTSVPFPTIIIPTTPSLSPTLSSFSGFLFSYLIAAIVVGMGMLAGWVCHVPDYQELLAQRPQPAPMAVETRRELTSVGHITEMIDCRLAESRDSRVEAFPGAPVPLGRKYVLVSGLMEIAYDSGAKVILEGPCVFDARSRTSGYLAVGKLTARVETEVGRGKGEDGRAKAEGGRRKAEDARDNQLAKSPNPQISKSPNLNSPLASSPSTLFSIRTPTAVVTDLGTEFGVEVDRSGACRAHVFRGRVEVRAAGTGSASAVSLGENQSARIDCGRNLVARVVRESDQPHIFVREMPKTAPIRFFNTGKELKIGDPDPHWQVVARSDDPHFKSRPAIVVAPIPANGVDNPARSQWIAPAADFWLPDDVVYVFRTTFDLAGILPSRATLRGRFIADDMVTAVRLNGHRLKVPLQHEGEPFTRWTSFSTNTGFVKGTNVLEVDVLNANPGQSPSERHATKSRSPIYCIVELEGEGVCDPNLSNHK
jgi:hypothetical protein